MSVAPPRILGIHATGGDGGHWLADGLSVRVLPHPRLGFPLGPLGITVQGFREHPDSDAVDIVGCGPGWRGNGEVDGTAWLRLVPAPGERRPPINVRLEGLFEPGTRVSVVCATWDSGEGIMSVSREPYILSAPTVAVLRVEGRCQIRDVAASYPDPRLIDGSASEVGLPFGSLGPSDRPLYVGHDPTGDVALERVRRGAPPRHAPHELSAPEFGDPDIAADAEVARVRALVFDGGPDVPLRDELEAVMLTPHPRRHRVVEVLDLIVDSPRPTVGTRRPMDALLAASGDPGVARWLGLATTLDVPPDARVLSVTVAGRWILAPRLWTIWVGMLSDDSSAQQVLQAAGLEDQFASEFDDLVSAYLWAQARIDLDVPPDPPVAPVLRAAPAGVWLVKDARDVVRLPIAFNDVVPLAQGGLVRVEGGIDQAVLPSVPGEGSRTRTLLVRDGTGVDLVADPPRDDGRYLFAGWQADMFGRWSDRSPPTPIGSPPRPGLPVPEIHWLPDSTQPGPVDEEPHAQRIRVEVPVPRRGAGEPRINSVRAALGVASGEQAATVPGVVFSIQGPPLGRAQSGSATLLVTFTGDDGSTTQTNPIEIMFIDPRAPDPLARDPVLTFADPPDVRGVSCYAVPLPTGPGIDGWRVFVTTDARLEAAAAVDGLTLPDQEWSRDQRANEWLSQLGALHRARFDCLTPIPLPPGRSFQGTIPGMSRQILFVRPVPQRAGVEPPFESCPMIAVAAPELVAPAPPGLAFDRTVNPPVLRLSVRPGAVDADHYRLRVTASAATDPRAGVIIDEGSLLSDSVTLQVPTLRPFGRAYVMAEVRAAPEAGVPPVPVRWSAPSPPVEIHHVPAEGPVLATPPTVESNADGVTVTIHLPGIATDPVPGPYQVRLLTRVSATAPWTGLPTPVVAIADGYSLTFSSSPGASYQIVLIDPIGRASRPVPISIP
jgi:hypothetical protein